MLIIDISGDLLQNDDNVSCVTGLTVITEPSCITQYRRSDIPELFRYAVYEVATESKRKHSVASMSHIQDFMDASKHEPIK